jgi:hypothetical protein
MMEDARRRALMSVVEECRDCGELSVDEAGEVSQVRLTRSFNAKAACG